MKKIYTFENEYSPLRDFLRGLPDEILYNTEHCLRHPLGLYNVSQNKIYKSFEKVLDFYESENIETGFNEFSTLYSELYHHLLSFHDDAYSILKCFYPKSATKNTSIFANQWMASADKVLTEDFKSRMMIYKSKVANVTNNIKHNQAMFSYFEIKSPITKIPGYCLLVSKGEGIVGGCEDVHPKIGNMATATSFNFDIRQLFAYHLIACDILKETLEKKIGQIYNEPSEHNNGNNALGAESPNLKTIFKKISKLRKFFFPNEYKLEIPFIDFDDDKGELLIEIPASDSYMKKLYRYTEYGIKFELGGDGATRTFEIPYMGEK